MDIESGRLELDHVHSTGWHLNRGEGERISIFPVRFDHQFTVPPKVVASLCRIDADKNTNTRVSVDVKPEDVRGDGFDLLVGTWANSIVYGVTVTWIAYGE